MWNGKLYTLSFLKSNLIGKLMFFEENNPLKKSYIVIKTFHMKKITYMKIFPVSTI